MICFDIDGVIINSDLQIQIDTLNVLARLQGSNDQITFHNFKEIIKQKKDVVKRFNHNINFAASNHDIVYAMILAHEGITIKNDAEFQGKYNQVSMSARNEWHNLFYEERYRFQEQAGWEEIITVYPTMVEFLRAQSNPTFITSKDMPSVVKIFDYFDIPYKKENIYPKEITNDKRKKLCMMATDHNKVCSDITFIDDNLMNLMHVKDLGVRCVLAAWGRNSPAQQELAKREGFRVIGLEDIHTLKR